MQLAVDQPRLARAKQHYESCLLCEHRCGVNRVAGERGFCKADDSARVYRHRIEVGEEIELIPSHLFYLSGCDLRCKFCIAEERAFNPFVGTPLTGEFLREAIDWGRARGARNLQWVGGEPTIHLPAILEAMSECDDLPPIVWKSDFHGTPETFELLDGVVDVYVADFKFGNDDCAVQIAGIPNYSRILTRNLAIAALQADLIVRHLLLPGHWDCCFRPIVSWLKANMPDVKFSIRDGYLPRWTAKHDPQLGQYLPAGLGERARQFATAEGLRVIQ
jgi:putative pyruvate formate lyase activating enzyme